MKFSCTMALGITSLLKHFLVGQHLEELLKTIFLEKMILFLLKHLVLSSDMSINGSVLALMNLLCLGI